MKNKILKSRLREARAELATLQSWVETNRPNLYINKDGFEENKRLKLALVELERERDAEKATKERFRAERDTAAETIEKQRLAFEKARVLLTEERDAARRVLEEKAAEGPCGACQERERVALDKARELEALARSEHDALLKMQKTANDLLESRDLCVKNCAIAQSNRIKAEADLEVAIRARASAEACYAALLKANHDREKLGGVVSITAHPAVDATTGHLLSPLQASQVLLPPEKSVMQTIAERVHEDEQTRRAAREYPPKCRHGHPMKTIRSLRKGYVRDVPDGCGVCRLGTGDGPDYLPRTDEERQLLEPA